ncbi:hypothetical protein [Aeromonas sp. 600724]|uniref:hypothetical protein n=1 Tax=Aeromonas TaxID=642 RepID=UPI003BA115DE
MVDDFLIKLGDPPRVSYVHVWADYVELLTITSADGLFSCGGLEDALGEVEDLAIDQEGLDDDGEFGLDNVVQRKWADIRNCFRSRQVRFGDNWPFAINDTVLTSRIDAGNPTPRQKLYIALLIASCLRYVNREMYAPITANLELIGYHIFKKMMPEPWIVRPFGAHQQIADGYTGTLFNKFRQLAIDLNADLILKEEELRPGDTGDGGIDLIAWHPMGDALGNIPVAFAQCGASLKDLEHKQFESSPVNLNSKILPQHPGMNYYFAPHDLRRNTGIWDKKPGSVVMIDRNRIMKLAETYDLNEEQIINTPHINKLINMQRIDV